MLIYGRRNSSNVIPVLWSLDEVGMPFERRDVGGSFGGLDEPGFRALNPNGRIPVMDDAGFILWESNAIVRYVAAAYGGGTIAPASPQAWARADQWMDWYKTTFYGPFVTMFQAIVKTEPGLRDLSGIARLAGQIGELLRIPNGFLQRQDFLAGPVPSIGDIPLGAAIERYFTLQIERPRLPALEAWHARLRERPAYQAHVMRPFGDDPTAYASLEQAGAHRTAPPASSPQ